MFQKQLPEYVEFITCKTNRVTKKNRNAHPWICSINYGDYTVRVNQVHIQGEKRSTLYGGGHLQGNHSINIEYKPHKAKCEIINYAEIGLTLDCKPD